MMIVSNQMTRDKTLNCKVSDKDDDGYFLLLNDLVLFVPCTTIRPAPTISVFLYTLFPIVRVHHGK